MIIEMTRETPSNPIIKMIIPLKLPKSVLICEAVELAKFAGKSIVGICLLSRAPHRFMQ